MHWNDTAIILSARKHGETSAVVRLFVREHGVYAGVVRGAHSKANRGVIQPGNIVNATWQARLSEHLGSFKCELLEANAAHIMQDAARLAALTSACTVLESSLPERHPYARLYGIFHLFLTTLREDKNWPEEYVRLEMELLAEAGFGLDLTKCAATGTTDDLIYVSPKSGRAVSRDAGEPYKEKLLALPGFLIALPSGNKNNNATSPLRWEVVERSEAGGGEHPSHKLIPLARNLRSQMPEAEKQLWYYLRAHRFNNYSFRRQHPISEDYIIDFICLDKKLIIELDGGQHSKQQAYDAKRTEFLEHEGYKVLRFWNNEVFENIEGVLLSILNALEDTPSLTLPPQGGGNNTEEILAGLRLTGYFLDHWLLTPHKRKLPAARGRLINSLSKLYG